jgi:hypothetical protein
MYGPPNSIEAHPDGGATIGRPYEAWHYKETTSTKKDVDIKFLDACNCGNYQLDPVP